MHVHSLIMMWGIMQSPTERPGFDDIKTKLADIASETFNSTPERALQTKRAKQQALLNQLLPSKVQTSYVASLHEICFTV